ncbi:hypothetical protein ElyMa_004939600 [Elysia marginata]|uniref:OAR domain-containing protein n=1 Tax=Elysia marginata TaxID=1093978 RepID=A0AAV4J1C6_9GAST|nr:hypothetical protein ElyMa_004939600 [Elysia marginata]
MESIERVSCATRGVSGLAGGLGGGLGGAGAGSSMGSFSPPGSCGGGSGSGSYAMSRFLPRAPPFADCMQGAAAAAAGMAAMHHHHHHGTTMPHHTHHPGAATAGHHLGYSPYAAADWSMLYHHHHHPHSFNNSLDRLASGNGLDRLASNSFDRAFSTNGLDRLSAAASNGFDRSSHGSHHHHPHHHRSPASNYFSMSPSNIITGSGGSSKDFHSGTSPLEQHSPSAVSVSISSPPSLTSAAMASSTIGGGGAGAGGCGAGLGSISQVSPHHHPAYPSPPLISGRGSQYDPSSGMYHHHGGLCGSGNVSPPAGVSCMSPDIDKKENKPKGERSPARKFNS